ncbi:hypothetical protein BH23ACT12_BH23ACT12_02970 [soil metagenome]
MKPRNRRYPVPFMLLALALLPAACGRSWEDGRNSRELPQGVLQIGDDNPLVLEVDLALTSKVQARGLMEVEEIADDYGMVFLWSDTGNHSFSMKDTLIPLDIAWWDEDGRIVDIQTMQPCTEDPCRAYTAAVPHMGAVEVNAGLLESAGIEVGDRVRLTRA